MIEELTQYLRLRLKPPYYPPSFFFFCRAVLCGLWDRSFQPGMEPGPLAVYAHNSKHWIPTEFLLLPGVVHYPRYAQSLTQTQHTLNVS